MQKAWLQSEVSSSLLEFLPHCEDPLPPHPHAYTYT